MFKTLAASGAGLAVAATLAIAPAASAHSTAVNLMGKDHLSASHKIAKIRARIICSPDTTAVSAKVHLTQTVAGDVQDAYGSRTSDAFECSGAIQRFVVRVRIPTGGYPWALGSAYADEFCLTTTDPDGEHTTELPGRTVTLVP